MHLHPLRILDFDPLPPQMPLIAGIIQAWQPLAEAVRCAIEAIKAECDDAKPRHCKTDGIILFRVAAVGWSPVPRARGLLEHVLDRQEQVIEWQRLGQRWYEFVRKVIACGKCLRDPHKLCGEPVFVIMIDDVDLQVERIRELLPALRLLYHPNVTFLVAAHWEHLIYTLELDFLGQQNRLANRHAVSRALSAADDDEWAETLAVAAASKVFPLKNKWSLRGLTLHELLEFPSYGNNAHGLVKRGTNVWPTMMNILNGWPRKPEQETEGLGDYLQRMSGVRDDPYEIPPFITYREAHQIFERVSMQGDESARAIEAVRLLISEPGSVAVAFGKTGEREPIIEYRGAGQLVALFRPGPVEQTSTSTDIVLGWHPAFLYRAEGSSRAISMQGYGGTRVNFALAMLAVSLQDGGYGVTAPALQWDIHLSLAWTRVEVLDENSLLKLAFQWRFHEHPHPFQLLEWSHFRWREFVRTFRDSPEKRVERIAYAWIFYQLEWLGLRPETSGAPSPLKTEDPEKHWKRLLDVIPVLVEDRKSKFWKTQDWWTRTLPLLARPEIGLPPDVQRRLLNFVSPDASRQDSSELREWLKNQRRRLVTDAIIAGGEEEGRPAENPEDTEKVDRIVRKLDEQYLATHSSSPWQDWIEEPGNGDGDR